MNRYYNIHFIHSKALLWALLCLFIVSCGPKKLLETPPQQVSHVIQSYSHNSEVFDTMLKYNDSLFFQGILSNNLGKYDEALETLTNFSKIYPNISATYFQMARAHIGKNSSLNTIYSLISTAYQLDSQNKWYMKYYADLISLKGQYLDAAQVYNELINQGNYDKEYFMKSLINYEKAGAYDSMFLVIDQLNQYTDLEDEYLDKLRMSVYQLKNDTAYVEKFLKDKIDGGDNSFDNQLELYNFYRDNELYSKSESLIKQLDYFSLQDNEKERLLTLLILSYDTTSVMNILRDQFLNTRPIDTGEIEKITNTMITAWEYSPRSVQYYLRNMVPWTEDPNVSHHAADFLLGYHLSTKNTDSALIFSQRSIEQGSMDVTNFSMLFTYYLNLRKFEDVIQMSQKALSRDSNYAIGHYAIGIVELNLKNYVPAYTYLLKAADNLDTITYNKYFCSNLYRILGDTYQKINFDDHDLITLYYEKALMYSPNSAVILNNYAYYLSQKEKDLDKAMLMAMLALNLEPDDVNTLDTYAWIMYLKGDYNTAREYLIKAINLDPEPSAILFEHLGDIESKLNNPAQAVENYKKAISADGDKIKLQKKIKDNE